MLHAGHGKAKRRSLLTGYHVRQIEYWWEDGDHEEPPSLKLALSTLGLLAMADLEPSAERRGEARRLAYEPFLQVWADLGVVALFVPGAEEGGAAGATDCAALAE